MIGKGLFGIFVSAPLERRLLSKTEADAENEGGTRAERSDTGRNIIAKLFWSQFSYRGPLREIGTFPSVKVAIVVREEQL